MESIEKLRDLPLVDKMRLAAKGGFDGAIGRVLENAATLFEMDCKDAEHVFKALADEIERDYMRLPRDADGVPIRVGDDMANEEMGPLRVLGVFSTGFIWVDDAGECYEVSLLGRSKYRHVKPDPVKELLDDVCLGTICYPRERITGYLEDNHSIGEAVLLDVRDRLTAIYDEQQRAVSAE